MALPFTLPCRVPTAHDGWVPMACHLLDSQKDRPIAPGEGDLGVETELAVTL